MNESFRYVRIHHVVGEQSPLSRRFGAENAKRVNAFHRSFPEYAVTPLVSLAALAEELGVGGIYVKDESYRFGLNAFKVLGGSYAIGCYIAKRLGKDISEVPYAVMTSSEANEELKKVTFVTATDGNHGRGVAWTANRLGRRSVVYMPQGTAKERLENILALGSDASIQPMPYDDCVRLARDNAQKYGWVQVQDTSWPGYEEIPEKIMEGYTTIGHELLQQLGAVKPTHIFLQAGVGSMAGAMAGFFADVYGPDRPLVTVVEPDSADCLYRTAAADDGELHFAGEMNSIMAGLCCGEPCMLAWHVLKECADGFLTIPDAAAAAGMRILGNPLKGDERITSGESGASAFGAFTEIMRRSELADLRKALELDEHSRVLFISTEGDTDRANYRRIVWDGAYTFPIPIA